MTEWWSSLDMLEKIYWSIALISSLFFAFIVLMTFLGGDVDDAGTPDAEIDSDTGIGFQFFTVKNLVGFFTVFSWAGLACIHADMSTTSTIIVSVICGAIMMVLMALLFFGMSKMAESGTLNMNNAVGCIGEVYLPIKKERESIGKIQIKVQGSLRELEALTDEKFDLERGTVIKVLAIISEEILLVEKLKK